MEQFDPNPQDFKQFLAQLAENSVYSKVEYYSEIKEYLKSNGIVKGFTEDQLELSDGTKIKLEQIVRINGQAAPGYNREYFKCDC